MSNKILELKGSLYTLSALRLFDTDLQRLNQALTEKLSQAPGFFLHAPVVVDLSPIGDVDIDLAALRDIVQSHQLVFVGISGASDSQKKAAMSVGISSLLTSNRQTPAQSPKANLPAAKQQSVQTKTVEGAVRSGQQVYAKGGDLIVLGSVSNGAEVIADGNIHIYGTLRGRAIAGASGNNDARIYCQNNQAELVSIAGHYWLSESLQEHGWKAPVCVRLADEKLNISTLT